MNHYFPSKIQRFTWGIFLVLLFLVVSLPTGSIFGVNVKIITFVLFVSSFSLFLITHRSVFSCGDILFVLATIACLCFWSFIGIVRGEADLHQVLYHLRDLSSAIFIGWLCIFAIRRGLIREERLIAVIVCGMFAVAAMKILLVAGSFFFEISPVQIIESVFGEGSLVGGAIEFNLVRLQFSSDILGAFAIFALMAPSVSGLRISRAKIFLACLVVGLGCGFLAYSRYLWFLYPASMFLAMVIERKWKTMIATVATAAILCIPFYDFVSTIVTARFSSAGVDISDEGRFDQAHALFDEVEARPLLGKGIGSHTNEHISNGIYLYGYEMQWLAFLMQFGVIGEAAILLLVLASMRDLRRTRHREKGWVALLFVLWLVASWTNPYLTSSFAGAAFGLFMAFFYRMQRIAPHDSLLPRTMTPLVG